MRLEQKDKTKKQNQKERIKTEACECGGNCDCKDTKTDSKTKSNCKCHDENDKSDHNCKCHDDKDHNCKCQEEQDKKNNSTCTCDDDCDCHGECHCEEQENEELCDCDCQDGYLNMLQRLQADFDNYRKRNATLTKESIELGIIQAATAILPLMDSFLNAKKQLTDKKYVQGIETLQAQFMKALTSLNIKKIDAVGKQFDPKLHHAVAVEEIKDKPSGIILEELQEGFMLNDKAIRYSMVKINK